jgi:hypothetical protein
VGRGQEVIREYIRKQEEEDKRLEQMNLWGCPLGGNRNRGRVSDPTAALSRSQPEAPGLARGCLNELGGRSRLGVSTLVFERRVI